ncbi:hypothetical protein T265_10429 [Opisthorchis viverrini]|uniref:Peptidase A1 domain-containing protein n=1 Tax=Opisthorchis viverrini TaxID=6198 RepID=A0A074Z6M6_OPIVI|nr:hypothetical protein T265_10429 [Opisthorchis viverrini]KER21192.1 hypothetical protein T265_10429 [Opisthorchis viverrini]
MGIYKADGDIFADFAQVSECFPIPVVRLTVDRTEFSAMDTTKGDKGQQYTTDGLFGHSMMQYHAQLQATPLHHMFSQDVISRRVFTFIIKNITLEDGTVLVSDRSALTDTGRTNHIYRNQL